MSCVVSVRFNAPSPKPYDYLTDLPLAVGDLVAVPTGSTPTKEDILQSVGLAVVVAVKKASDKATAWVMQKIDVQAFKARMGEKAKKESKRENE